MPATCAAGATPGSFPMPRCKAGPTSSTTPAPSRWICRAGASAFTAARTQRCSTRSWAPAPPWSRPCGRACAESASTWTPIMSPSPVSAWPPNPRLLQRTQSNRQMSQSGPTPKPRVALFVTCLVDLHRPTVGFAAIRLLEQAGCQVEVPRAQTCCGQPAHHSGDRATARDLAAGILDAFGGYDYIVAPSGSCAGMLKSHLPHLFDDDPNLRARADRMAERTFELTSFLVDILGFSL